MLYDDQAARFDDRAGVPADAAEAVAREVADLTGLAAGQTLLDVGCGTGAVSLPLLRLPIRYIGFDLSRAMLAVFHERAQAAGLKAELCVGDGNWRWMAEDGSADVVFSARALHHLDPAHAAAQVRRVLRAPAGWLVLGRVRRPPDSPKSEMRRQMRKLLEAEGFAARSHEQRAEAVFDLLERGVSARAETREAARWTLRHAPADSIAAWEGKSGLGGIEVPPEVKARVLSSLRDWAVSRYGDADLPREQAEFFELDAVRVAIG